MPCDARQVEQHIQTIVAFLRWPKPSFGLDDAGATANLVFGQTEDQVNKLKLLKRQMYGRATCAFLRHRFLLTA
jgi:transposase